jgi:excisionase family DNA binding protein
MFGGFHLVDRDTQPDKLDEFLTVSEAASALGVSPSTLRNWDRSGKLKAARHPINGYRLYKREDLSELMRQVDQAKEERGGNG